MLINWFTVAAQIINFLILVALLKHFLYGPIIAAMTARERKIAAQLAETEQKKLEMEKAEASWRQKLEEIEDQRQKMLSEAEHQAETYKKELFTRAREEVEQLRQKWAAALAREQKTFLQNLKQRVAQEVVAISRQALQQMANLELEQRLIEIFLERLRQLASEEQSAIRQSVSEAGGELLITTAFELSEKFRQRIAAQVQEQFGHDLTLCFATNEELLAGIELLTSSRKLAWSLGNFLATLEENLTQALQELPKGEVA